MSTSATCPQCGVSLTDAALGLCPRCLVELGIALNAAPVPIGQSSHSAIHQPSTPNSQPTTRFGDYELLELLAHGGMGVVYKARQVSLHRLVALKMIRAGVLASPAEVQRFHTEAEAIAQLHHPNIVAIHEIGEADGQHYFSMDYVAGRPLAEIVRDGPLPVRRAATCVRTIAEAMQYAHQHGVLHRDLKPANVMIDEDDQPRITDFGLAKRFAVPPSNGGARTSSSGAARKTARAAGEDTRAPDGPARAGTPSDLTLSGQILGSPNYLPPEQAEPHRGMIGPPSDVYALGAILYHLVTGRPPFQAESLTTLLRQVIETEPVAPRTLNPSLPRDLETICLKCLEKAPERRYPTAQALAEELDHFLRDEPIAARPVSRPEKIWRWCRRQPVLAALVAALIVTFVLGSIGVLGEWRNAKQEQRVAEANESLARRNAYAADMNLAQHALDMNDLGSAWTLLNRWRPVATSEVRSPKSESRDQNSGAGGATLPRRPDSRTTTGARQEPRPTGSSRATPQTSGGLATINPQPATDLRHWEWRYLWQLCQSEELFTLCREGTQIHMVQVSPDGKVLAVRKGDGQVALWDWAARRRLAELPATTSLWRKDIAFSPTGSLLAVGHTDARGQAEVIVWDAQAGRERERFPHRAAIGSLAFSPDGKLLAIFDDDRRVTILELASKQVRFRLAAAAPARAYRGVAGYFGVVQFSPDGERLAIGDNDARIRIVQWRTGVEIDLPQPSASRIGALAWSPAEPLLASLTGWEGSDSENCAIRLWNPSTGEPAGELRGHTDWIGGLAFSPDGQFLASASADRSIRLWRVADRTEVRRFQGHLDEVWAVAFLPDGKTLVSGDKEGTVRFWSLSATNGSPSHEVLSGPVNALAVGAGGRNLVAACRDGQVRVWNTQSVREAETVTALGTNNYSLDLSADGRWLAVGDRAGEVRIWDWPARRALTNLPTPGVAGGGLFFTLRGRFLLGRLACTDSAQTVRIWETGAWRELPPPPIVLKGIVSEAVSPGEGTYAAGYANGTIKLWRLPTGQFLAGFTGLPDAVWGLALAPGGELLASAGGDGFVNLWDVPARRHLAKFRGHRNAAFGPAFSSDGRRLAVAGGDLKEALKLWDVATLRELITLPGNSLERAAFSPDGNTLVAIDANGVTHLWHAPSLAEIEMAEHGTELSR